MPRGRPRKQIGITTNGEEVMLDVLPETEVKADESEVAVEEVVDNTPRMGSKEWNDYVIGLLAADEIVDGAPTVDGLRRVAQELLGPIVSSQSVDVVANDRQTIVNYKVEFLWTYNDGRLDQIVTFGGVGDVTDENADFPYCKYRGPLAETRAEGRALKKALGLKRILTADEVNPNLNTDPKNKANSAQQAGIRNLCTVLEINIDKFINTFAKEAGEDTPLLIEDISFDFAIKCIQRLNAYQADVSNSIYQVIPDSIKETK
jgi:hypothetical protein